MEPVRAFQCRRNRIRVEWPIIRVLWRPNPSAAPCAVRATGASWSRVARPVWARSSAQRGFERATAFADRRRKLPPIFSGQIRTGEIGGQFIAMAARLRSGHEQSVRDTELGNGKGFLPRINPLDTGAKAPGSFRHTQRFHGHNVAHASLGGQTPICPCDGTTNPFRYRAACRREPWPASSTQVRPILGPAALASGPSRAEEKNRPGYRCHPAWPSPASTRMAS